MNADYADHNWSLINTDFKFYRMKNPWLTAILFQNQRYQRPIIKK